MERGEHDMAQGGFLCYARPFTDTASAVASAVRKPMPLSGASEESMFV